MKSLSCVVVLLLVLGCVAHADDGALLRYGFRPGVTYNYKIAGSGEGEMVLHDLGTGAVQKSPQRLEMQMSYTMHVEAVEPDGTGLVVMRMGPAVITTHIADRSAVVELDLASGTLTVDGQPQELPPALTETMGDGIRVRMSPRGEVIAMEAVEKLEELLKMSGMSGFNISDLTRNTSPTFPEQPVRVGDSWEQRMVLSQGDPRMAVEPTEAQVRYRVLEMYPERTSVTIETSARMQMPTQKATVIETEQGTVITQLLSMTELVDGYLHHDYGRGHLMGANLEVLINMRSRMRMMLEGQVPIEQGIQLHNFKVRVHMSL